MSSEHIPVTVRILDREYQIACPEDERESLHQAADYLGQKLSEVRDSGRVVGMDRMAVMVALNLAHQFLQIEKDNTELVESIHGRLERLRLQILQSDTNEHAASSNH